MEKERITHELGNPDAWICICGNEPHEDGFFTCDQDGNEVEPDEHWTTDCYVCNACGRIIHFQTLEVVGRREVPRETVI
jgi:hypothetical protein